MAVPIVYTARHGETEWSLSGQHTGVTDIPLTAHGESDARKLGARLQGLTVAKVFTSPLQRARRTCELAGFGAQVEILPDAIEWNYGTYEGVTSHDIHRERPDWDLFRDGCPGGEDAAAVGLRADRVIERVRAVTAMCCCFPVRTSCACSRLAGSCCRRPAAPVSCSAPPRSMSSATSTTS